MSETALAAAYRALGARLSSASEMWETRAYADAAPASAEYPYVVYVWAGGGERNRLKKRDAELVFIVQAISDSMAEAFAAAARIETLLNDKGEQDDATDHLHGGTEWAILTSTQNETFHVREMADGAKPIFHDGARYRLVMEVI